MWNENRRGETVGSEAAARGPRARCRTMRNVARGGKHVYAPCLRTDMASGTKRQVP
jgi:hypothetical protein